MQQVDIAQVKAEFEDLFQAALNGEEVIITHNNQPILKLVRFAQVKKRQSGSAQGLIWMSPDFDEPLADFSEYME